jgi:SSS family solute:Na+ symporter
MSYLDWIIAGVMIVALVVVALLMSRMNRSVADFILAGRKVRKYLGLSAGAAENLGLAGIAANVQQGMQHGFAIMWISVIMMFYVVPIFGVMGLGIKRFRASKCMTIPQFLEQRFHKKLRLLTGIVLAISGILNMAIFPIVGSNFLVTFTGLPTTYDIFGLTLSTVNSCMIALVVLAVFFTFIGGMITVVVTDYIQATIMIGSIVVAAVLTLVHYGPLQLHETLSANLGQAAYNPFSSGSYGWTWVAWVLLLTTINKLAFAPAVQKTASADSPNTARKMDLLQSLFGMGMRTSMLIIGVGALIFLGPRPPDGVEAEMYFRFAGANYLREVLPIVLMGVVFAAMLFSAISTDDSYLLAWSAVIVNDIIMPLRKTPFSPRAHILAIRLVIMSIGIFIIGFGLNYDPKESILDYMYITGTLLSGIGIAVWFGLYWKRTTTRAAVWAITISAVIALADLFGKQIIGDAYPLTTQQSGLVAILAALAVMVVASLMSGRGTAPGWVDYGVVVREMDAAEKLAKLAEGSA